MTSLYFMKWNDDIFKEDNMFFPERNSKTRNDACKNIK